MVVSRIPLQRVLVSFLAISMFAVPSTAFAAGLCLQDENGRQYVLNKVSPKFAAAKTKPFGGVSVFGGFVRPLSGVATRSSNGLRLALAFTLYEADINGMGFSASGTTTFHQVAIVQPDGVWNVGDSTADCHWEGGFGPGSPDCTIVTAIDCDSVVIP